MHDTPQESDWKAFRRMVPELRERYLGRRIPKLLAVLQDESLTPTERFWKVEERIDKEAKVLRKCLDGHSRSRMFLFIMQMRRSRMLTDEDLEPFSDELREQIQRASAI